MIGWLIYSAWLIWQCDDDDDDDDDDDEDDDDDNDINGNDFSIYIVIIINYNNFVFYRKLFVTRGPTCTKEKQQQISVFNKNQVYTYK